MATREEVDMVGNMKNRYILKRNLEKTIISAFLVEGEI